MENELLQRIFAMVGGGGASANQSPVPQQFFAGAQRPVGVPQISSPAPPSFNQPRIASPAPSGFNPPQPNRLAPPDVETPSAPPDNSDLIGRFRDMLGGDQAPAQATAASPQFSAGSFLGDAAAGMTVGRPSDPPGRAIAQGFAGAMESAKARQAEARQAASDAVRAQRDAEEFGWKREDRPLDRADKAAKGIREKRESELNEMDKVLDIQAKKIAATGGLTKEDKEKLRDDMNAHLAVVFPKDRYPPATREEIDAEGDRFRNDVIARDYAAPAPATPKTAQPAAPAAAPVKGADGIYDGVTTLEQATALGSGAQFRWRGKTKIVP